MTISTWKTFFVRSRSLIQGYDVTLAALSRPMRRHFGPLNTQHHNWLYECVYKGGGEAPLTSTRTPSLEVQYKKHYSRSLSGSQSLTCSRGGGVAKIVPTLQFYTPAATLYTAHLLVDSTCVSQVLRTVGGCQLGGRLYCCHASW